MLPTPKLSHSSLTSPHQHSVEPLYNGKPLRFSTLQQMAHYISMSGQISLIDAVFCDPLGVWHHCTFAPSQCTLRDLKLGFPFDGSPIKLFASVAKSDMLMVPDPTSCWIDPFCQPYGRTLHVVCSIADAYGQPSDKCPRQIAAKAEQTLSDLALADTSMIGSEAEFFVLSHVRYNITAEEIAVELDSEESTRNSGLKECGNDGNGAKIANNLGHRMKQMYHVTSPIDRMNDLRSEMLLTMSSIGLKIEKHHHELGVSQCELGFGPDQLVRSADQLMSYKYIVKRIAQMNGKTATFMPKPMMGHNGSGLHINQSLWKDGKNLFFDKNGTYCQLSKMALHYLGGVLKHVSAICAFTNPTTNSYKRFVPDHSAPCHVAYSKGNRSAAVRIPLDGGNNPNTKRIECRFPDPSSCPYLACAVVLMAGIDGIVNNIVPPPPTDSDLFNLSQEDKSKVTLLPLSLPSALDALEVDHEFLLRNNVFTKDFLASYIKLKREEARMVELIPHPKEFELYYHL